MATGIEEHNEYGKAYVDATARIRQFCLMRMSRAAISTFLLFSLKMTACGERCTRFPSPISQHGHGIVNAGQLGTYEDIPVELRV